MYLVSKIKLCKYNNIKFYLTNVSPNIFATLRKYFFGYILKLYKFIFYIILKKSTSPINFYYTQFNKLKKASSNNEATSKQ